MQTFFISYTVRDGEHEYGQLCLIEAQDEQAAYNKAGRIIQKGGYAGDYRMYEVESVRPLTQAQLEVIKELGVAFEL